MTNASFLPKSYSNAVAFGSVSFQSPSNIALVKYWGKYGAQLPQNTSISFTLNNCRTETTLQFEKKKSANSNFEFEVYLDKKRALGFEPKIKNFFERIDAYMPFLRDYTFKIETSNTFPHSSGIASSASGMSALAASLVAVEKQLLGDLGAEIDLQKASFLARLGSGSASRSLQGPLVVWGEHAAIDGSSNLVGVPYPYEVHAIFQNYQDTILLVDKGEKQVSSSVGHDLMHSNPYAQLRFEEANANIKNLINIFKEGDIDAFIGLVESEALQLHAMMMASKPYFILMKPHTLEILNRIWEYRAKTGSKVCFTLDAGANVHVLYPANEKEEVQDFIATELASFCKNGEYIHDHTGMGASLI